MKSCVKKKTLRQDKKCKYDHKMNAIPNCLAKITLNGLTCHENHFFNVEST